MNWILICSSEKKDLFPRCYLAKQFFGIAYFTDILSFEKFSKNLRQKLKLIFLFSTLFVHFKIGYRQSFITVLRISFLSFFFFFLIYELNTVVSIHSNVFYPATLTLKMLYVNFFGARFVTICLFCRFFIHLSFRDNFFLTFWLSFITVCYDLHPGTINENQMKHDFWDMECNRQNFFSFWTIPLPHTA